MPIKDMLIWKGVRFIVDKINEIATPLFKGFSVLVAFIAVIIFGWLYISGFWTGHTGFNFILLGIWGIIELAKQIGVWLS